MIVLSLFDGMSCGRIALDRLGIKPMKYFASEIDKHAIKVSKANWDDITHIGDVTKVRYADGVLYTEVGEFHVGKIDLLIGGVRVRHSALLAHFKKTSLALTEHLAFSMNISEF